MTPSAPDDRALVRRLLAEASARSAARVMLRGSAVRLRREGGVAWIEPGARGGEGN